MENETPISCYSLECEKCSSIPEYTLFYSSNKVKLYITCENRHVNFSLLDEYLSDEDRDEILCKKCNKKKKICQFCSNEFCEQCNINHLTIDHISDNLEKIYNNNKILNLEKDDKFKNVEEKISKSFEYMKEITNYYKEIEKNYKKKIQLLQKELII